MSRNLRNNTQEHVVQAKQREKQPRRTDLRIRRTRERLGAAMIELILEKSIEEVTVREVLDRASVGRSTFYVHFRDKNDLLLSQLEQFLEFMSTALINRKEVSLRVVPVAEMFGHIASARKLYRALADGGHLGEFFDLAQGYFERGIERRLVESKRLPGISKRELAARASALAGSLLSLLQWWMDHGAKEPPNAMDEMFHRMVWKGVR